MRNSGSSAVPVIIGVVVVAAVVAYILMSNGSPCNWPSGHCDPSAESMLNRIQELATEDYESEENQPPAQGEERPRMSEDTYEKIKANVARCLAEDLVGIPNGIPICDIQGACEQLGGPKNLAEAARGNPNNGEAKELWLSCNSGLDSFPDDR